MRYYNYASTARRGIHRAEMELCRLFSNMSGVGRLERFFIGLCIQYQSTFAHFTWLPRHQFCVRKPVDSRTVCRRRVQLLYSVHGRAQSDTLSVHMESIIVI